MGRVIAKTIEQSADLAPWNLGTWVQAAPCDTWLHYHHVDQSRVHSSLTNSVMNSPVRYHNLLLSSLNCMYGNQFKFKLSKYGIFLHSRQVTCCTWHVTHLGVFMPKQELWRVPLGQESRPEFLQSSSAAFVVPLALQQRLVVPWLPRVYILVAHCPKIIFVSCRRQYLNMRWVMGVLSL